MPASGRDGFRKREVSMGVIEYAARNCRFAARAWLFAEKRNAFCEVRRKRRYNAGVRDEERRRKPNVNF